MASGAASSCRSPSQPATDASLTEGPTPEQKAAAREVDPRMNYEEINESPEDRLGETTPVQIFHPVIRIDSEEEEEAESSEEEGGQVYRLQFPSGVYLRDNYCHFGERLFLFRMRNGPGP